VSAIILPSSETASLEIHVDLVMEKKAFQVLAIKIQTSKCKFLLPQKDIHLLEMREKESAITLPSSETASLEIHVDIVMK